MGMDKKIWVAVAGAAMVLTTSQAAHAGWNKVTGHFERSLTVNGEVNLDIHAGCGDVQLREGAGNTVAISGQIEISSRYSGNAEQRVKDIAANPPVQQTGNIIRIEHEPSAEWRNICVNYTITTPHATRLKAHTGSGNISAESIAGPVDADSGSGDVRLEKLGGMTHVHTGSGNIRAERIQGQASADTGSGDIEAVDIGGAFNGRTGSGNLRIHLTAPGSVEAATGSGDIDVSGSSGSLHATTGSGNIHADGDPKGPWHLSTGSGEVSLRLPADASVEVAARSASGSVSVERPMTVQGTVGRREVHGKIGNGGPLLEVSTGSGDISIR